eukprot:3494904-Lingulodinium_polyedra.AAC.1
MLKRGLMVLRAPDRAHVPEASARANRLVFAPTGPPVAETHLVPSMTTPIRAVAREDPVRPPGRRLSPTQPS